MHNSANFELRNLVWPLKCTYSMKIKIICGQNEGLLFKQKWIWHIISQFMSKIKYNVYCKV